jgi:hypothetical protein
MPVTPGGKTLASVRLSGKNATTTRTIAGHFIVIADYNINIKP